MFKCKYSLNREATKKKVGKTWGRQRAIRGMGTDIRVGLGFFWLKLQLGWYLLDVFGRIMDYVIKILEKSKTFLIFLNFTNTANHVFWERQKHESPGISSTKLTSPQKQPLCILIIEKRKKKNRKKPPTPPKPSKF